MFLVLIAVGYWAVLFGDESWAIGCTNYYFPNSPDRAGKAKWVSESPEIWFVVEDDAYYENKEHIYEGEIISGKVVRKCEVRFTGYRHSSIGISSRTQKGKRKKQYVWGECEFSEGKFEVKVDETDCRMFRGETLIFEKQEIEE